MSARCPCVSAPLGSPRSTAERALTHRTPLLATLALLAAALSPAGTAAQPVPAISADEARRAAETLADMDEMRDDASLALAATALMLRTGATVAEDDPYRAGPRLAAAQSGATGLAQRASALQAAPRGSFGGESRADPILAPGESYSTDLRFVVGELASVEARLKTGSDSADLDLYVYRPDGTLLDEHTGPDSGTGGAGVYVDWIAETCDPMRIELRNSGTGIARAQVFALASRALSCTP